MKNQKGFIFPTTMVMILFCLLIVGHIATNLISEKQFYAETEQYYLLENLMQLAVDQSLMEIKSETTTTNETTKNTLNGSFTYTIRENLPSIYEVQLSCATKENKTYTASYQYDSTSNEMISWSEY
ncbi:competence type IV pilus minor pilin ComGG [Metabacillus litoralis]|uniref:competence type IV pilus minor pilin ComGG n=1 Tax=Metabacillus litoralis TaxID=152268 RepID=UPI002040E33E|nr:competence type IV pilus minor pilin ComGG [Metabacillus litoralis]MCM3650445.1 ComGG family competence protein [Metabacillus litoralis]